MAISRENRDFVDGLLDYYVSEAESYRQMAENFGTGSAPDTAFGIIVGCVYSGFMQAYQNQQQVPDLGDMKEFHEIIGGREGEIRGAILGRPRPPGPGDGPQKGPGPGDAEAGPAGQGRV